MQLFAWRWHVNLTLLLLLALVYQKRLNEKNVDQSTFDKVTAISAVARFYKPQCTVVTCVDLNRRVNAVDATAAAAAFDIASPWLTRQPPGQNLPSSAAKLPHLRHPTLPRTHVFCDLASVTAGLETPCSAAVRTVSVLQQPMPWISGGELRLEQPQWAGGGSTGLERRWTRGLGVLSRYRLHQTAHLVTLHESVYSRPIWTAVRLFNSGFILEQ